MSCPWDSYSQARLEFCEENLCSWLKEPSNVWTNVAYLFVGLVILRAASRKDRPLLRWIGMVSVVTGLGSAFYHASGISLAGIADYFGMFLGTGALTALNVRRWLYCRKSVLYVVFLGLAFTLTVSMVYFQGAERILYMLAMPCCVIELRLFFRDRKQTEYRNYFLAWILIGIGVLFWWLDLSGILCNPKNHLLTGHGVWHTTTAAAFFFFFLYYLQFEAIGDLDSR